MTKAQPQRRVQIGVAQDVRHLATSKAGDQTWWCGGPSSRAGDMLLVYKTRRGLGWVLEILGTAGVDQQLCATNSMVTYDVRVLRVAATPVDSRAMKSNDLLGQMGAVRRCFQGKLFDVTEEELAEILLLMQGT